MLIFNTEMHLVTFIFVLLELMMLACQLFYYFSRPQDKRRLWFLWLLLLLLFYNLTGGLFPDPEIGLSIILQNILAYGSGFLMASYFPWYFYKNFELAGLRFHAVYGVLCFLILPYVVSFILIYPFTRDLEAAVSWGMIVPFVYSLVLFFVMLRAVAKEVLDKQRQRVIYTKVEMYAMFLAVTPWICMSVFSYLHINQWIEALVTNLGFVWVFILFMARSAQRSRTEHLKLQELDRVYSATFESNCERHGLTGREVEIAALLGRGLTYMEIAATLFIAGKTVDSHIQNIFLKTGAKNKIELLQLLGFSMSVSTNLELGDLSKSN